MENSDRKVIVNIPSIITDIHTKANNITYLKVECQEVEPETAAKLHFLKKAMGYFTFKEAPVTDVDLAEIPAEIDKWKYEGKTPSQRLRACIYRLGEKNGAYKDGETKKIREYYDDKMEQLIEHVKGLLD